MWIILLGTDYVCLIKKSTNYINRITDLYDYILILFIGYGVTQDHHHLQ